ncbi:replication initiation protein RepC [Celeribacter naphthalenivorans]|uniref:replication initiation protein RepC n=1 Tax=Celeribacter naphthalenivorans TaxID=1614694 RepID=UPI001CFAFC97|nr:replication initiation protein RepC [Celeribacter naphthalenivorans]
MSFQHISAARKGAQQRYHNGLPERWNRDRYRKLCTQYAQLRGASAGCVRTLEIIFDLVPPGEFTDPHAEPFCFSKQETLIAGRGITPRSLHNHEVELERIGLIERRVGANGARCRRKRLGLFLTPGLNILPDMLDALERDADDKKEHDELRGARSRLYRHVKGTITVLASKSRTAKGALECLEEFKSWPRSDKLISLSLGALKEHVEQAESLLMKLNKLAQIPKNISGQPENHFGCHIQDQIEDNILSCNANGEDKMTEDKSSDINSIGSEPHGSSRCEEKKNVGANDEHNHKTIPRVSNRMVYELASDELKMHIDIANGGQPDPNPGLYQIEVGAWTRLSELGTNRTAWEAAIAQMGLMGAIIAALITDAKTSDPKNPVASPGGYLRSLTHAAKTGELNLLASFMGLLARREREAERQRYK